MSRRRKLVLFLVVLPFVLLVVVVAALLTPAVQTYAARKVLADQGGEVERVSVGLGGASLSGLRLAQPGLKLTVPSFRADVPLTDLVGGRVEIRSLVARDIVVELDPAAMQASEKTTEPKPTGTPERDEPFRGVLDAAKLPELRIDAIDIAGRLRVLGVQPVDATFALSGGGIRAGRAGELILKIEAKAGLGSVVTSFTLRPTLGADGRLDALGAVAEAFATSRFLAELARLRATVDIARADAGETYALRLLAGETPLVELATRWAPGAAEFPGTWKIAIRDADLAPFALGLALPEFQLAGGGDLAIAGTEKLRLSGDLNVAANELETLGLPALGPVSLTSSFNVEAGAAAATLDALKLEVKGATPVLVVETKQRFTVHLETRKIDPGQAGADLAEIRLLGVPTEWVKVLVPELGLSGPVTGAWTVRAEGDGFVAVSSEPLVVAGVSYASAGEPLVAFGAVRVEELRVKQTSAGMDASVGALRVLGGDGAELVRGQVEASRTPGGPLLAKGELRAALAKLADQPVLRGQTRLSAGQATANFDAALSETIKAAATLRLSGLRAAGAGDLPEVTIEADLTRNAAGVLSAKVPVAVRNAKANRASDLVLEATLTPEKDVNLVRAKLGGQVLYLEDLQAFSALAAESAPAPKPTGQTGTEGTPAPEGPLWAGTIGELEIDLPRIVYAPGIEVVNTQGRVALTREAANLEKLRTVLGTGGEVSATGALRWNMAEKGYELAAEVAGENVALGPLMKTLNPAEPPKIEGVCDLRATVAGQGSDPAAAVAGAAAELRLTGTQGVVRALSFDTNKYARLGSSAVGTVAGLIGAFSKDERTREIAGYATAVLKVTEQLSSLTYDEFALEARRATDGSVEIEKLNLFSPQLRLAGAGGLRAVPGRSLWEMPLRLQVQLSAKGEIGRQLEKLNLLAAPSAEGEPGAYLSMKEPLVFDGTLRQVGTTQAMRLITKATGF